MSPELTTADLVHRADVHHEHPDPDDANNMALFSDEQRHNLTSRWEQIQASFVDEPRGAVEKADALVAEAIANLAEGFARTRADLDGQWKRGDSVSTEDLRQALRHYRAFFGRLLRT
jgi:hypothetical protein